MLNLNKVIVYAVTGGILFTGCKVNKNTPSANNKAQNTQLPAVTVKGVKKGPYRETAKRTIDIEHMSLDVRFNYEQQYVLGKAVLTIKPYFYQTDKAELDARGFDINRIALLKGQDTLNLKYDYKQDKLFITLDKVYQRTESFKLFVDYVAKPNDIKGQRGVAITDDKGLYFINPTGKDGDKPRQIWTQGETQSNSCWFPTVDIPNEKITQDISITVQDKDITLSNGELMKSKNNTDGTRTDFWRQTKPHAVYLVMMTIGEFACVKDYWRDSIPVDYYVESAYKPYAKMVFGNTPEMMEVFSRKLGVDYPWDKYSQIVVRDFVSGAMENTSAVVHYDALQHDAREHLDNPHEDIVAHELFHHWFGDLVTCESWSNLPLNESFATYGEYIWQEHKYGQLEADCEFYNNFKAYIGQKNKHRVEPIRYHYNSRDDMFDVVSYQKGGLMLHMLRRQIGDEAFFAALKLYLTRHAYRNAELADLRMAFEEVTGEDLNWFFNQWFLKAGHPVLEVKYAYDETRKMVKVNTSQAQDSSWGVYRLPLAVDIYTANGSKRQHMLITEKNQEFTFTADAPMLFVNVDADKALVGVVNDIKDIAGYREMVQRAPLYKDKLMAVEGWMSLLPDTLADEDMKCIAYLMNHDFWGIRNLALPVITQAPPHQQKILVPAIARMAKDDTHPVNRVDALELLAAIDANGHLPLFEKMTGDSAYSVVSAALLALAQADSVKGMAYVNRFKQVNNAKVQVALASIIATYSANDEVAYFEGLFGKYGYQRLQIMNEYVKYLQRSDKQIQQKAITGLSNYYQQKNDALFRAVSQNWIRNLQGPWKDRMAELEEQKQRVKKDEEALKRIDAGILEAQMMIDAYKDIAR